MSGPDLEALLARGELVPAAEGLCAAGRHPEASAIYERLGLLERAAACAHHAGDPVSAHRLHLSARAWADAARDRRSALEAEAPGRLDPLRRRLADQCVVAGRHAEAASLYEVAGELRAAAEAYGRCGDVRAAARLLAFAGRHREAVDLLSGALEGPSAPGGADGLRVALARSLLRLGRPEEALLALLHLGPAQRHQGLVLSLRAFALLGWEAAAAETWSRLAPTLEDAPADHRTFLARLEADGAETGEEREARWVAGRYRLERLLGAGGAGQVYLAVDAATERRVALKLLAPGAGQAVDRFFREARIARSLEHPGIVPILEADPERGYIALEYLPGGTLADRLRGGRRLSQDRVRTLGGSLADALAQAHRRGILHRDVKPENVLFDAADRPRLGDFGAAHLLSFRQTATGYLLGTLAYMAPEQLDEGPLCAATDLWGLAVTLYRALTGRLPFPGPDIAEQQRGGAAPSGSGLDAFFARAFALEAAYRFPDAAAFAEALAAAPPGPGAEPEAAGPAPETGPASAPESERYLSGVALGARVVLARDAVMARHVVVEQVPELEGYLERVAALAASDNPHLQPVLDLDAEAGLVVWGFVEGRPLPEWAAEPRGEAEGLRVAADLALALVDHPGAVRPRRIIVGEDGRAVVAVAGSEALRSASAPLADARPACARVLAWVASGRDPGEAERPPWGAAPADPGGLAGWLEALLEVAPLKPGR